jgi:protein-disulfide isomerase
MSQTLGVKIRKYTLLAITSLFFISSCSQLSFEEKLAKTLEDKPEIITKAIEKNPARFMIALQNAARVAQKEMAQQRRQEEERKLEASFDTPLSPNVRIDEAIRGSKDAPITLIEYSDFECPYCSKAAKTVESLRKRYGDKIKVIYKHRPLSFHKYAMVTSMYYEALRLQNENFAFEFHDEVFKNQKKLKGGKKYLESLSKKIGADMKRLAKDLKSKEVVARINEDISEAEKYKMQGTPGFILNGVPIRLGAVPEEYFVQIVEKLTQKNKLKL